MIRQSRLLPGLSIACAMMLMLTACDSNDTMSPEPGIAGPSNDYVYTAGPFQLIGSPTWSLVKVSRTQVIGRAGGRLVLGFDELIVPAGAVDRPTVFRMEREIGSQIVIDLDAHDRQSGNVIETFNKPVELKLSYMFANVSEPERLVVLWLKDGRSDGELVPMPTTVLTKTRHIVGSLTHFSQYAMGLN
jgi:hypothetical protein